MPLHPAIAMDVLPRSHPRLNPPQMTNSGYNPSMDLLLKDKIAIVTGGSRGIGKAIAKKLAFEGSDVVICARNQHILEESASELESLTKRTILPIQCDTTRNDAIQSAVNQTYEKFGRIDILINNAAAPGGLVGGNIDSADEKALMEDIDTKVIGYFRCAKLVAPIMKSQKSGRIINIGGLAARNAGTYSGLRNLALVHMTKTLSLELAPCGVTVNIVHPGQTLTEKTQARISTESELNNIPEDEIYRQRSNSTDIRRIVEADEVATLVTFLSSPISGSITGESIACGGGVGTSIYP